MRSSLKHILFWSLLVMVISCDESAEKTTYKGPDYVFFDAKAQLSLYENQRTPLVIPLKVNLPQGDNTDVSFEVIGENLLAGSDYKVQTSSPVTILRGQYASSISIQPVDNNIIQPETRTITVRITAINNPKLTPQIVKEIKINLLEDDCLPTVPKVSVWVGSVLISGYSSPSATGTGEGGSGGICGGTLLVTGKFFGSSNPASAYTIAMIQNPTTITKGTASVTLAQAFTDASYPYNYQASGTYDEVAKTITLNFTLYNSDGSVQTTGTHIISPK